MAAEPKAADYKGEGLVGDQPLDSDIETNWDECIETFDAMELREDLLRGIYGYGFEKPSAIQQVRQCSSGWAIAHMVFFDVHGPSLDDSLAFYIIQGVETCRILSDVLCVGREQSYNFLTAHVWVHFGSWCEGIAAHDFVLLLWCVFFSVPSSQC